MKWTITLPPLTEYRKNGAPKLWLMPPSLNKRLHWSRAGRIKRYFEEQMFWLLVEAKVPKGLPRIAATFTYFTSHPMDADNLASSMKCVIDAMTARKRGSRVGYGVIADDSPKFIQASYGNAKLNGGIPRVEVTITDEV